MKSVEAPIILADSISPEGIRLITWQLRYWRPIHAELMTHRVFSRNAGSSRARPSKAIIEQVSNDPWGPTHWGLNEPGMQANTLASEEQTVLFENTYREMARQAAEGAELMNDMKLHKQLVNRPLEPYTYIDVVLSGTDFNNWYALRDDGQAEPHIRDLASMMKEVQAHSEPQLLLPNQWHLPYIDYSDRVAAVEFISKQDNVALSLVSERNITDLLKKASAARCARVSYKLFDGTNTSFEKDLELFDRLLVSQPLHASPAEHQATPDVCYNFGNHAETWEYPEQWGNFRGWRQFRKMLPNEFVPG